MKLKALDQISVSSVKADSLRPNEEFTVSEAVGNDLLKAHPGKFAKVSGDAPAEQPEAAPISAKSEPPPLNKAEPAAPANKATNRRKRN
jgi:hypothetical protein